MEQQTTIKDNWNSIEPKKSLRVIRPPVNLEEHITLLSLCLCNQTTEICRYG